MSHVLEKRERKTKRENLVGKRFCRLIVIELGKPYVSPKRHIRIRWICKCDCGNTATVSGHDLKAHRTSSCGCLNQELRKQRKWTGYKDISGSYFCSVRENAKKRNIPFEISIQYIWDIFLKQHRKCALSGRDLYFATHGGFRMLKTQNASLDRIDSTKPYIEGNVQWIDKEFSDMKMERNDSHFFALCKEIADFQAQQIDNITT